MTENPKKNNKICARLCVEICGFLKSPVLAGSGEDKCTDGDVILAGNSTPFVPGSSLAGALRNYIRQQMGRETAEDLFGGSRTAWKDNQASPDQTERQSRMIVYDTMLEEGRLIRWDGIKLNEYKCNQEMAKYEVQAVEPGCRYRIRLEIWERELMETDRLDSVRKRDLDCLKTCVFGLMTGEIRIGARNRRGFGRLEVCQARVRKFDMTLKDDHLAWLNWSWESQEAFQGAEELKLKDIEESGASLEHCLQIPLKIRHTILIRQYSGKISKDTGIGWADYEQLTMGLKKDVAVIPGSSWAGALRSRIAGIVKIIGELGSWEEAQQSLDLFFGSWFPSQGGDELNHSSYLIFEESLINGGHGLPTMRNAIDRFTGGTVDHALYAEIPWAGGETELVIRWPVSADDKIQDNRSAVACGLLLWAAYDLQEGILAVGGETGVGRGIFDSKASILLDGKKVLDGKIYKKAAADWCRGLRRISNGQN